MDRVIKNEGLIFPPVSSEALNGERVTLPVDAQGYVTLIVIAFQRDAQRIIDTWLVPFSREFSHEQMVRIYEIPMIGSRMWKMIASVIDEGMRSGIPVEKHPFVVTYYGDIRPYVEKLGMDDLSTAYFFLLDRNGRIQWRSQGVSEQEGIADLIQKTRDLLVRGLNKE